MTTTRIIYDGTNPENADDKLYLQVIEINDDVPVDEVMEMVAYVDLTEHPDLERALAEPLATLTIDYSDDKKELLARAPKEMKAFWQDEAGDISKDDEWVVIVQTILLELVKVTGAKGVFWSHM